MYFVYIIRSRSTKKFYTGFTNDIDRRLREHNSLNSNSIVSRGLTDFELVYVEEARDRLAARKLEKYFKSGSGREFRDEIVK